MHPELYYLVHQQDVRELEQRLAREVMRREAGLATARRGSALDRARSLTASASVFATGLRTRLAGVQARPALVECCAAA